MSRLADFFRINALSYKEIPYAENITDALEAAKAIGLLPSQMIKSLVVGDESHHFVMCLVPVDKRLDLEKLGLVTKTKMTMASPVDVEGITGYKVGTVCPFLLKNSLPIYMDKSLLQFSEVGISTGETGKEIVVAPKELQRVTNATLMQLV